MLKKSDDILAEVRRIDTGLKSDLDMAIIQSVFGQLSDGLWENSPMMDHYWPYIDVEKKGGKVYLLVSVRGYPSNRFLDMDDSEVKTWLAKKIKAVIKDEELDWSRSNREETDFLSTEWRLPSKERATVADCYYVYEVLRGRNVAKHPEYNSLQESYINEETINLFGIANVNTDNMTRSQVRRLVTAKRNIEQYLKTKSFRDLPKFPDVNHWVNELERLKVFRDPDMHFSAICDRIGITQKKEEFKKQKEDFNLEREAYKKAKEEELAEASDMEFVKSKEEFRASVFGGGSVLAFKDISPSIIRFELSWSYPQEGEMPVLKGAYGGGWCSLCYGTLGHGENAPRIPSWTIEDGNAKNWPLKATPETFKEVHDFLKANPEHVENMVKEMKAQAEEIANDIKGYKGRNWSGD